MQTLHHILQEALQDWFAKGEPTKLGYLILDPCGFSITIWRLTGVSVSETSKYPREKPVPDPMKVSTYLTKTLDKYLDSNKAPIYDPYKVQSQSKELLKRCTHMRAYQQAISSY